MIDRNALKDAILYAFNKAMKEVGYSTDDIKPVKISFTKSYKGDTLAQLIVKLGTDISYIGSLKQPSKESLLFEFIVPSDPDTEVTMYMFEDDVDELVKKLKKDFAKNKDISKGIQSSEETVAEIKNRISLIEAEYDCTVSIESVMPSRKGFPVRMSFRVKDIDIDGIHLSGKTTDIATIDGETIRAAGDIWVAITEALRVDINSPSDVEPTTSKIKSWLDNVIKNTRKAIKDIKKCIKIVHDNEHIVEEGCDKIENLLERRGLRNPSVTYTPNFDFGTPYLYLDSYMFIIEIKSDDGFKTKYRIGADDDVKSAMDSIYTKVRRNSNRFVKKPADELSDIML